MTTRKNAQTTVFLPITQNKTKKVILAALFAALAYVSIQSLHVAIFAPIGAPFFHVGNAVVALAALYLGFGYGTFSGAIGLAIFDIVNGYAIEMPIVFLGNVLVALTIQIVYKALHRFSPDKLWLVTVAVSSGVLVKLLTDFLNGLIRALVAGASLEPAAAAAFLLVLCSLAIAWYSLLYPAGHRALPCKHCSAWGT